MHTRKRTVEPFCRRAYSAGERAVVLLGLSLATPSFAVDRTWNSGFGSWSQQSMWTPNGLPGPLEHVFIGTTPASLSATVHMDVNGSIAALDVAGQARLHTDGRRLTVNGLARIDGSGSGGVTDLYAGLQVSNGANAVDFQAASLQILAESLVMLESGPSVNIDGSVLVGVDGRFLGNGNVTVGGTFTNSGEIQVFGGDMTINVTNGASINLDGTADGEIIINDSGSDLNIAADAVTDPFDGRLFLGGDSVLTMAVNGSWATGPASLVQVAWFQSSGYESTIQGSPLTIGGGLMLYGTDNTLRIESETTFAPTAHCLHRCAQNCANTPTPQTSSAP